MKATTLKKPGILAVMLTASGAIAAPLLYDMGTAKSAVWEGFTRAEIADRVTVPTASVSRALRIIRGAMRSCRA